MRRDRDRPGRARAPPPGSRGSGVEVGVELQAYGRSHAPTAQSGLHLGQQIAGPRSLRLDLRVAGHANRAARDDVVPVVEPREVQSDDVLEEHELVASRGARQLHEPRDDLARQVNHRELGARKHGLRDRTEGRHEAQRAVREVRKWVPGVDRERREHRQERAADVLLEEGALGGCRVHSAARGRHPPARAPARARRSSSDAAARESSCSAGRHRVQGLGRRESIGTHRRCFSADHALQAGDADHEELVQVRAHDCEELHPLEQRDGRVEGLLEHALVELQPRELAVDVAGGLHPYCHGLTQTSDATVAVPPRGGVVGCDGHLIA